MPINIDVPGYGVIEVPDGSEGEVAEMLDGIFSGLDHENTERAADELIGMAKLKQGKADSQDSEMSNLLIMGGMRSQFAKAVENVTDAQAENTKAIGDLLTSLNSQLADASKAQKKGLTADLTKFTTAIKQQTATSANVLKAIEQINMPEAIEVKSDPIPAVKEVSVTDIVYGGKENRAIGGKVTVTKREAVK